MEITDTIRKVQVKLNLLRVDWINGSDMQHFSDDENDFFCCGLFVYY